MGTVQLITCFRFSVQLFISEGIFLIGRPKKEHFGIRILLSFLAYILGTISWFFIMSGIGRNVSVIQLFFFVGLLGMTLLMIYASYDLPWIEVLFVGTGGYAVEHITFASVRILQYFTGWDIERLGIIPEYLIFRLWAYVLVAGIVYVCLLKNNLDKEEFCEKDIRIVKLSMLILFTAIILSVFYTSEAPTGEAALYSYVICPAYSMMCCILVIIMEQYLFRENRLTKEKETMEQLLRMADSQQKSSKEAIDIINIKCHDLKHQMKHLQRVETDEERSAYIEEIKNAISIYDATYHTGCEALDYILREKTLISDERNIAFSCMADGTLLHFMDKTDLYALLGNALDNALEQQMKEEEEMRMMSLRIQRSSQMVMIHLENTCSTSVEFRDGMPFTTKKDKNYHGFGVRSMAYIVEKYEGNLVMYMTDGKFILDIAIPLEE